MPVSILYDISKLIASVYINLFKNAGTKTPVSTGTIGITGDEIYLYLIVSTIKRKNEDDNKGITATDHQRPTANDQPQRPTARYKDIQELVTENFGLPVR